MLTLDSKSKVSGIKTLINGANQKLDTTEKLMRFIHKTYNAECGSGFYTIQDIDIASQYANRAVLNYGGEPLINFFNINIEKIIKDGIMRSYFNTLDLDTMEYLSHNIVGKLPNFCKLKKFRNLRPIDVCFKCNEKCSWNSSYIESILLDCIDINLSDIFIDYYDRKIDIQEASKKIYESLDDATDGKFKFQIVLRGKILDIDNNDYMQFLYALPAIIK